MAIEDIRQCGYRKVGGLYLCGSGSSMACDRLPYELVACPVCGGGVKFTRGWTWLDWLKYAGMHKVGLSLCSCALLCPVCHPEGKPRPYGLLWVGESFYTPQSFIQECIQMGVSKRISAIPKNLKLGETWVLFAHKKLIRKYIEPDGSNEDVPGIFYAFRPQRYELLIWKSEATDDKLAELQKKHITPIVIPDGDPDHDPDVKEDPKARSESLFFESMRRTLER